MWLTMRVKIVVRMLTVLLLSASAVLASPASAQFFFKSHDMSAPPARGDEPGALPLPGATPEEVRANLVWNLRSALNVAALQCQFEPSLLSVENYNVILVNHNDELKKSYAILAKYFNRTARTVKIGQDALDQFGTRTYSAFTTVGAQYGFCQTAGEVANEAAYAPRGELYVVAVARLNTLRNALVPWGEEQFRRPARVDARTSMPRMDAACWTKKGDYVARKCGEYRLVRR